MSLHLHPMQSWHDWHGVHGVLCLDTEVGQSDGTLIEPLTEDAFIANLHQRFKRDQIYTYVGTMVIAINPYKKLAFYSPEVIAAYQHHNMLDLPPHIYAIAEHVFQSMKDRNQDQCIITTGESGSGKTESGKIALQYLILGATPRRHLEYLKEQLLSTSSVLEAFGNAMTVHNNNSSRFGMFLEIEFDFKGDPMGGIVTNYLLEKSRVTRLSSGERNFHIFYQILTGADLHMLKCLKLQRNIDNYSILSGSQSPKVEELDDKTSFMATKRAMEIIGFSADDIFSVFQIVSAVLKLGNLQFLPRANMDGTEGCSILNEYEIYDVCELLLTDMPTLEAALTQRIIETRHEFLVADLCSVEAKRTRDALCKALYSRLFTWIVNKLNECIKAKTISKRKSVGILDIYGFEVFESNLFEQFLINYCNEKLHQIFIDMTLKQEQEDYIKEGIQWKKVDFFNNSVICELIEKNNHGILSMLDEECLRPNPVNDEVFLQNVTKACQDNPYFESHGCKSFVVVPHFNISCESHNPSMGSSSSLPQQCFRLRHFAGSVTYSVNGFVDKNNDLLYRDLSYVMYQSQHPLLKILFPEGNPYRTQMKRPASIATQFRISIGALMKNIQSKQLNFIKCIKPNELKEPLIFETGLVQHQVRYLLLLESCKLRKAGYFYKEDYDIFLKRYKMLSPTTWPQWRSSSMEGVSLLLKEMFNYPSDYAFGKSKIFIKSLKMVNDLDDYRNERLNELAVLVQKVWRGWVKRKLYLQLVSSQRLISRNYKCWKRKRYLLWLAKRLPSHSPLCREWPSSPRSLQPTNYLLRKIYHKWRCNKYRLRFDQTARNRMREKVTASLIFRDRKASYKKSVSHPFRGDYVRLRQSVRWKRTSAELGDQYVVFADIVNKITKSGGKFVQKLLVLSTSAMIIMDQRTMQVKYRIPVNEIYRISLSSYMDEIVVIHLCCEDNTNQKKAFVFESGHVIEIVTKLFLVIQNALGKPPEVQIANEFEVNFGKEVVTLMFHCSGPPELASGPARINRRGNKMQVTL